MSSKSACYAEISRCEKQIAADNRELEKLRKEVEELRTTSAKTSSVKSQLVGCESKSAANLDRKAEVNKVNERIVGSYYHTMDLLVRRTLFPNLNSGLINTLDDIQSEIQWRVNRIADLQSEIASCNGTIREMRAEIARIEAEEERERERQRERERERERERSCSSSGPGVSSNGPASAGKNYSGPASAKGPGYV